MTYLLYDRPHVVSLPIVLEATQGQQMGIGHPWAGRVYGTNTGNLSVRLYGPDEKLTGVLRINDTEYGISSYQLEGSFVDSKLVESGKPAKGGEDGGDLSIVGKLDPNGELTGEWETTIGTGGTFRLSPHDQEQGDGRDIEERPEQLYTARWSFGAVSLDRDQFIALADEVQSNFENSQVVVTVAAGTEQIRLLSNFKGALFTADKASSVKLYVQEADGTGLNRVVVVEFFPQLNAAMVQGADEAWVLGMLEKLKQKVRPLEQRYATNFWKHRFGINQLLIFGAVVYLPSLNDLLPRTLFMAGVLGITFAVTWLHGRYLPNVSIQLNSKKKSFVGANALSWAIAASSGVVAALLAALLQQWFPDFLGQN